jgi:hypothetical protein
VRHKETINLFNDKQQKHVDNEPTQNYVVECCDPLFYRFTGGRKVNRTTAQTLIVIPLAE